MWIKTTKKKVWWNIIISPGQIKNTQNANKSNCNHPYIDVNDAMNQFEESSTDWCIFCSECHVALDRNPESGYIILLLRMIQGDLLSACPHRQFHTLPGLLDSWAALPNSYPNACMPMQGGSLYYFYDGLWYDPTVTRTHDLLLTTKPTWHGNLQWELDRKNDLIRNLPIFPNLICQSKNIEKSTTKRRK